MSDLRKSTDTRTPFAMIGIGVVMVLVSLAGAPVPGREWLPMVLLVLGLVLVAGGFVLRNRAKR